MTLPPNHTHYFRFSFQFPISVIVSHRIRNKLLRFSIYGCGITGVLVIVGGGHFDSILVHSMTVALCSGRQPVSPASEYTLFGIGRPGLVLMRASSTDKVISTGY